MPSTTTPDGVTIAFRHHGGHGPALLLAHATGFCGQAWRPVATRLVNAGVSVWSLDFRGHGRSERPPDGSFDWSGTAIDVLAVLDAVASHHDTPRRWVGAGHSMGGAALLLAQQARPGAFDALWVFEPIVMSPEVAALDDGGRLSDTAARRRPGFASRRAAFDNYSSKPPMASFDHDALEGYLDDGLRLLDDGSVELACRPTDEAQMYLMGGRHDASRRLDEINVAVTVATGSTEVPGPAGLAGPVAYALPDGRLEPHPELGHFGPFEQPEVIARSILEALGPIAGLSDLAPTIPS